jgi:hypothetical protein
LTISTTGGINILSIGNNKSENKLKTQIIARRWNDSVGTTYHSAEVFINHKFLDKEKFSYGYGDQYKVTAFELVKKHNLDNGLSYTEWCRQRENILFSVTNVSRKRDL